MTNNLSSENIIINKYLNKLNQNKLGTFNFKNDASFLKLSKNKKLIITNDTILENIDFFQNDPPESIANKIATCNLSDISAMGAYPYAYTLSLCLSNDINNYWLERFSKKLLLLQKKYNYFLLGGDLSKSKDLVISANFFGFAPKEKILTREGAKLNDDIWITGNLGESYIGLLSKKNLIKLNKIYKNYYINKYLYPIHSSIGYKINTIATSAIDISDGLYGDLEKLLISKNIGANIYSNLLPFSKKTKSLLRSKMVKFDKLLSSGDDYELLFTANTNKNSIIKKLAKSNNIKISKIGTISKNEGIYLDDKKIKIINKSFQHFF